MYKVCLSEQSANRQQYIEKGLLELMETKRYEDISISDLCNRINIPRKAFYRYFSGKDGALYAMIDHIIFEFKKYSEGDQQNNIKNAKAVFERFFQFWVNNKKILDIFERNGLSGMIVERSMFQTVEDRTFSRYLKSFDEDIDISQIMTFVSSGLMSMVIQWHHSGMTVSARQMAATAVQILTRPIFTEADDIDE